MKEEIKSLMIILAVVAIMSLAMISAANKMIEEVEAGVACCALNEDGYICETSLGNFTCLNHTIEPMVAMS